MTDATTHRPRSHATRLLLALLLLTAAPLVRAASAVEIDARVREALTEFRQKSPAGAELLERAAGALVFPRVLKAGIGIGGEYGEGALLVNGETASYYNVVSASVGFQLGGQVKRQVILFMTNEALTRFRNSDNWKAGVDGSIAVVEFGAAESIDTKTLENPIIGFVFSNKGLMYNLTFEGSKFTPIDR